jgi:hypothetical protein
VTQAQEAYRTAIGLADQIDDALALQTYQDALATLEPS